MPHYKTQDIPLIRLHSLMPIISQVRRTAEGGGRQKDKKRGEDRGISGWPDCKTDCFHREIEPITQDRRQ